MDTYPDTFAMPEIGRPESKMSNKSVCLAPLFAGQNEEATSFQVLLLTQKSVPYIIRDAPLPCTPVVGGFRLMQAGNSWQCIQEDIDG